MRSSDIFLVRVVTSTRSSRADRNRISSHQVVDLALGRLDHDLGVNKSPVGRMICSTNSPLATRFSS